MRPAFPQLPARLTINGEHTVRFPLGGATEWSQPGNWTVTEGEFTLRFEARRFVSLVEPHHRVWAAPTISGFYRLTVPAAYLKLGKPLRLRVELPPARPEAQSLFFVSPRRDAL
jgi:hypothetical protein